MNISMSARNVLAIVIVLVVSAGLAMMATDSASAKANGHAIAVTGVASVDG